MHDQHIYTSTVTVYIPENVYTRDSRSIRKDNMYGDCYHGYDQWDEETVQTMMPAQKAETHHGHKAPSKTLHGHISNDIPITTPLNATTVHKTHNVSPTKRQKMVVIREPPRSDKVGYSVIKIEEKQSTIFHSAIPAMPLPIAVMFCIFNILVPGIGTLLCSPFSFCCPTRLSHNAKAFVVNILSALLQMLTFLLIVGWIWSILWGMTMVQLSLSSSRKAKNVNVPYYVRRQSSVE